MSKRKGLPFFLHLAGGFAVIAVVVYGFVLLVDRPGIPEQFTPDAVAAIDGVEIRDPLQAEFVLAWKEIGESAEFSVRDAEGGVRTVTAPVAHYYGEGASYPVIYLVIGLLTIGLGFTAFLMRSSDVRARLFFRLALGFGAGVIVSGEVYCLHPRVWPTYIPGCLFILAYAFIPAFIVHFASTFLAPGRGPRRKGRTCAIYAPGALIAAAQLVIFFRAFLRPSMSAFRLYLDVYPIFRAYLIVYLTAAVVVLIRAYRRAADEKTRAQILWVALGNAFAIVPFVLLFQIPVMLGVKPLLSEEVVAVFLLASPMGFAVAILRYRLMDVTVVINRGLVYSLLTAFTLGVYLLVIEGARELLAGATSRGHFLVNAAGVFLAAAAFEPARRRIQDAVDRVFFRQRYDHRRIVMEFTEQAKDIRDRTALLDRFAGEIRRALPVDRLSVVVDGPASGPGAALCRWKAGDPLEGDLPVNPAAAFSAFRTCALPDAVRADDEMDFGSAEALSRLGIALFFPLPLSLAVGSGYAALGRKRSGERFSREDISLLRTLAGELALNLERLWLQEAVILERTSKEKLVELDRLKTEFISTVSHELRTPMSAIQGMAEVLQAGKVRSREQRERYLDLMVAETGRLSRFIHNVLDFGRIEMGAKTYHFVPADLRSLVEEALAVFREPLAGQGFAVRTAFPGHPVVRRVDPDAVKQALINVIDNAIKYSAGRKEIVAEVRDGQPAEILIRDSGIGIAPEEREKIFERFYRTESAGRLSPEGAGLGLKIVRHIMDGHGGEVRVESEVDAGTMFRLVFNAREAKEP